MLGGQKCEACNKKDEILYSCPKCQDRKVFCFRCISLCRKCKTQYQQVNQIPTSFKEEKTKTRYAQIHNLGTRRNIDSTSTSTTGNHIIRQFKSIDPISNRMQKDSTTGLSKNSFDSRKDHKPYQYQNLRKADIKIEKLEQMVGKKHQEDYKQTNKYQPFKKDNCVRQSSIQTQQLTKQKEINQVLRMIKVNKGFVHNGCKTTHKLYQLTKALDESKKESQFVYLPECKTRQSKEFLKEIIKDRCLMCSKQITHKDLTRTELKNGYYICYNCQNLKPQDKQMAKYYESLFYICVSCEYNPIKRKTSELHIVQGQDPNQIIVCRRCFDKNADKEKFFKNISEIQKKNHKQHQIRTGMRTNNHYDENHQQLERLYNRDYRQPNHLIQNIRSQIMQKQTSTNYYRHQQSLPKKLQQKPANQYSYKTTHQNNTLMEDYGLNAFNRAKIGPKKPQQKIQIICISCSQSTIQPIIVDGLPICNACNIRNQETLIKNEQQNQKEQIYHKFQDERNQQRAKYTSKSLSKSTYDRSKDFDLRNNAIEYEKQNNKRSEIKHHAPQYENFFEKVKNQSTKQFFVPSKTYGFDKNQQFHQSSKQPKIQTPQDSRSKAESPNTQNDIKLICSECNLEITETKNVGLVTENKLVLCRKCQIQQEYILSNQASNPKTIQEQKSSEQKGSKSLSKSISKFIHPQSESFLELEQSQISKDIRKKYDITQPKNETQFSMSKKKSQQQAEKPLQEQKSSLIQKNPNDTKKRQKQKDFVESNNSLLKSSSISSRKSFKILNDPKRHQVEYSDILTQSIRNEMKSKTLSNHEVSGQKEERQNLILDHQLSYFSTFDQKQPQIPTNDTVVKEQPFKALCSKINSKDPRLTSTQFQHFNDLVTTLNSNNKKFQPTPRPQQQFISAVLPQNSNESFKNTLEELSSEKVIKDQKIDIELNDLQKNSTKINLINCNLCNLMIEQSKGFYIDQKQQQQKNSLRPSVILMCQQCYFRQHYEVKHAEQIMRKNKIQQDKKQQRQKMYTADKKYPIHSLRIEQDSISKRSPSINKAHIHSQKTDLQKNIITSTKPYQEYGVVDKRESIFANFDQKNFLEQKLAKTSKQNQDWKNKPQSNTDDSPILKDESPITKKKICTLCKQESSILCFEKYCLECFKKQK